MWLMESSALAELETAYKSGVQPTAEELLTFEARLAGDDGQPFDRVLSIAGGTANISIGGVLTNRPNFYAHYFGGGNTTYGEINAAIAEAERNPDVKTIDYDISSGGGQVDGLFGTIAAMQSAKKPSRAIVSNLGASAAYALAAQADKVIASDRATRLGSVGIVQSFFVSDREVAITSTEAPNKHPDVKTEKGKAVIRAELDEFHDLFAEAIATGRGTTPAKVNKNFGRGATVLADTALQRGMIDSIADTSLSVVDRTASKTTANQGGNKSEKGPMDLQTLKAEHPGVFAAAVEQGREQGVKDERDRVCAHLTMGASSGDMKTATDSIEDGSGMPATIQAKYMAAGMNRASIAARGGDNHEAGGALDESEPGAKTSEDQKKKAVSDIMNLAAETCGIDLEA